MEDKTDYGNIMLVLMGLVLLFVVIYWCYSNWSWLRWVFLGLFVSCSVILSYILFWPSKNTSTESLDSAIGIKEKPVRISDYVDHVIDCIMCFEPSYHWPNETGYHAELHQYLRHSDLDCEVELQTGGSRPDLVLGDVALEIKGKTTDKDIHSLATKCLKYSRYYNSLLLILFHPCWEKDDSCTEILNGILANFDNVHIMIYDDYSGWELYHNLSSKKCMVGA